MKNLTQVSECVKGAVAEYCPHGSVYSVSPRSKKRAKVVLEVGAATRSRPVKMNKGARYEKDLKRWIQRSCCSN